MIELKDEVKFKLVFPTRTWENNAQAIHTVFELAYHVPIAPVATLLLAIFEKNREWTPFQWHLRGAAIQFTCSTGVGILFSVA